jgi:hypothetical protein
MMRIILVKNFSDRPKHLPIRSMAVNILGVQALMGIERSGFLP